jgi:hypothetical protein
VAMKPSRLVAIYPTILAIGSVLLVFRFGGRA